MEQVWTNGDGSNGNKLAAAKVEITATCFRLELNAINGITPARVSYENKSARGFWNGKLVLFIE